MTAPTYRYTVGQTVRWSPDLRRDWYEGRTADGAGYAQDAQVGRVADRHDGEGYCGLCEYRGADCPGPWYSVDFGDGPSNGLGGLYAEHELEAA